MPAEWADALGTLTFRFGTPEYAALIVLILAVVVSLAPGSLLNAGAMAAFGLLLGSLWGIDPASGVQRDLWGLHIDEDAPLPAIAILFGFLMPRIAHYARRPDDLRPMTPYRLAYNGLLLYETLPALLLMRQRWLPERVVLPLVAAWVAALMARAGMTPGDLLLGVALFALGVVFLRVDGPWLPAILGLQFSLVLETNLRRAVWLSDGDWSTFAKRPVSATLLVLTLAALLTSLRLRQRIQQRQAPGRMAA